MWEKRHPIFVLFEWVGKKTKFPPKQQVIKLAENGIGPSREGERAKQQRDKVNEKKIWSLNTILQLSAIRTIQIPLNIIDYQWSMVLFILQTLWLMVLVAYIYDHIYFGQNKIKLVSTVGDELIAARANWERLLSILFQDDQELNSRATSL